MLTAEFSLSGDGAQWARRTGSSGGRLPARWLALRRSLRWRRTSTRAPWCARG